MAKFQKKVYRKLDRSPLSEVISPPSHSISSAPKKIIPSNTSKGLREEFKKTFLPLLIDVFELRQMIDNYMTQMQSSGKVRIETPSKSPKEILDRLEQLQQEIEESQRWCEGVILQIAKGIDEAKEALTVVNGTKEDSLLKRLLRKIKT